MARKKKRWTDRRRMDARIGLRIAGTFLLVGLIFLSIGVGTGVSHIQNETRFRESSAMAEGMVLEKWTTTRKSSTSRWVRYRFHSGGSEMHTGTSAVGRRLWDSLAERTPVAVKYLPEDPSQCRIEGHETSIALPVIFTILGSMMSVAAGIGCRFAWKEFRKGRP